MDNMAQTSRFQQRGQISENRFYFFSFFQQHGNMATHVLGNVIFFKAKAVSSSSFSSHSHSVISSFNMFLNGDYEVLIIPVQDCFNFCNFDFVFAHLQFRHQFPCSKYFRLYQHERAIPIGLTMIMPFRTICFAYFKWTGNKVCMNITSS